MWQQAVDTDASKPETDMETVQTADQVQPGSDGLAMVEEPQPEVEGGGGSLAGNIA